MEPAWNTALRDRRFRRLGLVSLLFLIIVLTLMTFVLGYVEARSGSIIEKGWLAKFPPGDLSGPIFWMTYGFAALGIITNFLKPQTALALVQAYALLSLLRCITLLLVPLDPPEGIIPLNDPLLQNSFYAGRPNLKDLFFSGHAATLFLFAFLAKPRMLKIVFTGVGITAGVLLSLQRVHYVSDVLAAPFFACIAWLLTQRWPALLRY